MARSQAVDSTQLEGRVCIVTGATSGIGRAAATALAARGAELILVARNRERAERTAGEISEATGNRKIETLLANLSLQSEVRGAAETFLASGRPLHILLNNAGVFQLRREETAEGFETTFAVNHLAYFLLTTLLLPRLTESAPARIVNVASGAHAYSGGRLDFDDLQSRDYSPMKVYAKSKLANILFTQELARRLDGSGVTANCLHPGMVGSNLAVNNGWLGRLAMGALRPFARSNEKGAETAVYLCCDPGVGDISGGYFYDCKRAWPKTYARNEDDAARLWRESEAMCAPAPIRYREGSAPS